jgi:uncharacterized membrane protein
MARRDGGDHVRRWLGVAMAVVAALTVLGLVALWPRGDAPELGDQPRREFVNATVVDKVEGGCEGIDVPGPTRCWIYTAELTSGQGKGQSVEVRVLPTDTDVPELEEGDKVVLVEFPDQVAAEFRFQFFDLQRTTPLLWLGIAFVVVVVAFGRFQGARALAGLGLSLAVLVWFVVPALLRESPAVFVALVGTTLVAFLAIYLAHGIGITSTIALAGSLISLAATTLLALLAASMTQLSGLADEEAQILQFTVSALDLRGLLIAGIVVGALGVLDDVTVSQVSTVSALRRANPNLTSRQLYTEATHVGRDHVASTVNTLVLAYAGASLPLLLFFAQGTIPSVRVVTGELVSMEIVRMLVGSIGLVLSVPITTWLAAVILSHTEPLEDDGHGHHHHGLPPDEPEYADDDVFAWAGPQPEEDLEPDPWADPWPPPAPQPAPAPRDPRRRRDPQGPRAPETSPWF